MNYKSLLRARELLIKAEPVEKGKYHYLWFDGKCYSDDPNSPEQPTEEEYEKLKKYFGL